MLSLNGNEGCHGKSGYSTFHAANKEAKRLNRKYRNAHANPYKCSHCKYYHIGNTLHRSNYKMEAYNRGERKKITKNYSRLSEI